LLAGCATVNENLRAPTVELVAFQPQGLGDGRAMMALTRLRVSNPNSIPLPIAGGQVNMGLNGEPVAVGDLTDGFTLPANGSEDIDIRIGLDLASALTVGMALLEGETELPYSLDGYIDVGVSYLGRILVAERGVVTLNQLRVPDQPE
jgi:LEA14-like dessication related protein